MPSYGQLYMILLQFMTHVSGRLTLAKMEEGDGITNEDKDILIFVMEGVDTQRKFWDTRGPV